MIDTKCEAKAVDTQEDLDRVVGMMREDEFFNQGIN